MTSDMLSERDRHWIESELRRLREHRLEVLDGSLLAQMIDEWIKDLESKLEQR
jgi:hypothetical protein